MSGNDIARLNKERSRLDSVTDDYDKRLLVFGTAPDEYHSTVSITKFDADDFSFDTKTWKEGLLIDAKATFSNVNRDFLVFLRDGLNDILGDQ